MAKAFPIQNIGQITETVIGGDIVDVSDNFAFAFETAGYMCKGRIYTARVIEREEEPITLGKILQKNNVDDKFYITNEKMPKWTYLKGAKKSPENQQMVMSICSQKAPLPSLTRGIDLVVRC